jgi:hypothetical protein
MQPGVPGTEQRTVVAHVHESLEPFGYSLFHVRRQRLLLVGQQIGRKGRQTVDSAAWRGGVVV